MTSVVTDAAMSAGDRTARTNAITLAFATGLAGANASVLFATGALVGHWLSGDLGLATIPTTFFVLGTALASFPVAYLARNFGRRQAFLLGNLSGAIAGLTAAGAIYISSFALFCFAGFAAGCYHAVVSSYRYAAADTATAAFRPKAISWVLTGGVASALIGPQIVIWTQSASPQFPYLITFLVQAGVALAAMLATRRFIDQPIAEVTGGPQRSFAEIAGTAKFAAAVLTGTMAQMLMNFVMTAAPLAMNMCGHSVTASTLGIQWHILGMFAPSFFTGSLIARFGKERVAATGLALLAACGVVNLLGLTIAHFWIGLILLGVGWNFAFIAATAMVTDCHTPSERAKIQGFNDFMIFGITTLGSLLAGVVLQRLGWGVINAAMIPVALACIVLVLMVRPAPAARPVAAE
jgi:MFS family permease